MKYEGEVHMRSQKIHRRPWEMKIRRGSSYAEPEKPQEALGDENTKGKFICGARKSTGGLGR
jgi:hypothetical protein